MASHDWNTSSICKLLTEEGVTEVNHLAGSFRPPAVRGVNTGVETEISASTPLEIELPRLCRTSTDNDSILSMPPEAFASSISSSVSTISSISGPGSTVMIASTTN